MGKKNKKAQKKSKAKTETVPKTAVTPDANAQVLTREQQAMLEQMTPEQVAEYEALKARMAKLTPEEKQVEMDKLRQKAIMDQLSPEQREEYLETKARVDAMSPAERDAEMARIRDMQMDEAQQQMASMQMGGAGHVAQTSQANREAQMKARYQAEYDALSPEKKEELEQKTKRVDSIIEKCKIHTRLAHFLIGLHGECVNHPEDQTEEQRKSGLAHEKAVKLLLKRTKLGKEVEDKIWTMADADKRGALDPADFMACMVLAARAQKGLPLVLEPHTEDLHPPVFHEDGWELEEQEQPKKEEENEDDMPSLE